MSSRSFFTSSKCYVLRIRFFLFVLMLYAYFDEQKRKWNQYEKFFLVFCIVFVIPSILSVSIVDPFLCKRFISWIPIYSTKATKPFIYWENSFDFFFLSSHLNNTMPITLCRYEKKIVAVVIFCFFYFKLLGFLVSLLYRTAIHY